MMIRFWAAVPYGLTIYRYTAVSLLLLICWKMPGSIKRLHMLTDTEILLTRLHPRLTAGRNQAHHFRQP